MPEASIGTSKRPTDRSGKQENEMSTAVSTEESLGHAVADRQPTAVAIELLKLKELSLKEAAALTGSSESSLKVATHRAIANLRKALGEKHL